MRSYRLNMLDGSLTLLSAVPEGAMHNPAFSRRHPSLNVVYACTESVKQEGQVVAMKLDGSTGKLVEHCPPVGAGGTSTCYLTIHKNARRMLLVNYWNSTICTLEMLPEQPTGDNTHTRTGDTTAARSTSRAFNLCARTSATRTCVRFGAPFGALMPSKVLSRCVCP